MREGMAGLLERGGYEVVGQARDGSELMQLVHEHRPDLAITDIRMPPAHQTEGLEAARAIREQFPDTAILILSAHVEVTEAMTLLARSTWPGNIEQLWQVIRQIVRRKRVGSIEPADLPPECWAVSRRLLSPLEALERDAIVQALLDSGGNKAKAAESLGMSRATIYRKIHGYGIVIPAS